MKALVLVFTALALTAACNGTADDSIAETPATNGAGTTGSPAPAATASAGATASGARTVSEETDDFVFDYAYPAEAGNIPELARLLDRMLERSRETLARQAAEAREDARGNGFPYNKFSNSIEWQVVADLPGWLSLSGEIASYTGGAHGNYGMRSLIWNKQAGEAMRGIELFTSPRALGEALGDRYCEALEALRIERGTAVEVSEAGEESVFPACPPIDELVVLVGSSDGEQFDRLSLYAGPYVAGAFAEGAYQVDLAIDQAVLGVVKPRYREAFSARG